MLAPKQYFNGRLPRALSADHENAIWLARRNGIAYSDVISRLCYNQLPGEWTLQIPERDWEYEYDTAQAEQLTYLHAGVTRYDM